MRSNQFFALAPTAGCLLFAVAAAAAMSAKCHAFHGATVHAWHRTWYAQDALHTPLRGYFVPRLPGRCDRADYVECPQTGACAACASAIEIHHNQTPPAGWRDPCLGHAGCVPTGLERLGQIPNDAGLNAALPPASPGR